MALTKAKAVNAIGLTLLLHAAYSSQEFTRHSKLRGESFPFPIDIYLEIAIAIILFLYYALLIYPSSVNQPKQSITDSNRFVNSKTVLKEIQIQDALVQDEITKTSDFYKVENRVHYVDWFEKRKEFDEWTKQITSEKK